MHPNKSRHQRGMRVTPAQTLQDTCCPCTGWWEQQWFAAQRWTHFTAPKCHSTHSKSDLASSLTAQWWIMPIRRTELPAQRTALLLVLPALTPSTAPCCSLLLSPSRPPLLPHFSAPPMSQALLSVHSGLNIGLPWPVLLAKPRGVLILAAVSALYPISLPALRLSPPAIAACQPPALRPSLVTQQGFPLLPTNTLTLLGTLSQQDLSSPERSPVFKVCRCEQMRISIISQKLYAYMWHCLHYASHCPGNGWTLSFKKADLLSSHPALLYSTFCKGTKSSVQGWWDQVLVTVPAQAVAGLRDKSKVHLRAKSRNCSRPV